MYAIKIFAVGNIFIDVFRHRHLDISTDNIHYFCDELEDIINYQLGSCHLTTTRMKSTGEEATLKILHDFDQLAKHLRNLDGLVLAINSIIGISPVFRYTEVQFCHFNFNLYMPLDNYHDRTSDELQIFPPVSSFSRMDLNVVNVVGNRMVLKMLPKYCPYLVFPFEGMYLFVMKF